MLADVSQIGQLMTNLLGNALKFCGDRAPVVHVGAVRDGSSWRISVRDNGIGIETRYFERIFQMFQRLHLRGDYEGTGIGLTICKKVVNAMVAAWAWSRRRGSARPSSSPCPIRAWAGAGWQPMRRL